MVNEYIVLGNYLEQLEADKVSFLAGRESQKSAVKKLIINLRDCQNMHEKIQIAKELWKSLFEASLTHIDPDKRGYDDLFKFFDEYVEFEELIFASDAFYRDHTIHCLWVYFLGEYLYRNSEYKFIFKDMLEPFRVAMQIQEEIKKVGKPHLFSSAIGLLEFGKISLYGDSLRCLTALTHDLGYPLKKIRKINASISKILPYFSIDQFDEFAFSFNNTQTMYVKDFLEYISLDPIISNTFERDDEDNELLKQIMLTEENGIRLNTEIINTLSEADLKRVARVFSFSITLLKDMSKFLRYSKDFERHEHGILSAFLLIKTLGFFSDINLRFSNTENTKADYIDVYKVFLGNEILHAISDHTSDGFQIESINSPSSLLTFVDELEEFSRISRANKSREYINEFCKTDIFVEDGVFNVSFIFDNDAIDLLDPELAFKGRCKKLLKLLKISNLDNDFKLRMRCIGKLSGNYNTYCIEISRKYANITINGEEVDIPGYLNSKEFYTKEQYASL